MNRIIPTLAIGLLTAGAWASQPAPSITIQTDASHARDVAVAIMESPAVGKIIQLRVVSATPYSVVFAGPQGTGSGLIPTAHAEIDLSLIPISSGTRVTATSYSVAGQGNVASDASQRSSTTGSMAHRLLIPLLGAIKRCAADPVPKSCPNAE